MPDFPESRESRPPQPPRKPGPDTRVEYQPQRSENPRGTLPRDQPATASDLSDPHATRSEAAVAFTTKVLPQIHKAFHTGDFTVDRKSDKTPVTEVDRDIERRLREMITQRFPEDGIHGEEGDDVYGTSGYRWILDPIDGTRPFVHGVPLFGTLVAVEHVQGESRPHPVVGVCATGAGDGCRVHEASLQFGEWTGGVYRANGKKAPETLGVRECESLKDATVCYTQIDLFGDAFQKRLLERLVKRCRLVRGWGDCYGHMMVATGRADVMIDTEMSLWDAAALQPIAKAAGATFMTLDGEDRHDGGSAISVVPSLADELLTLILQCRAETL